VPGRSDSAKRRSAWLVEVSVIAVKATLATAENWPSTSRTAFCWAALNASKPFEGSPEP
jgi:hypothetical protein